MENYTLSEKLKHLLSFPVIVAALGYFVDIYDLLLFGIVRVPSLKDMNLDVDTAGTLILNYQMVGLLLGGILWGVSGMILFIPFIGIVKIVTDNITGWEPLNHLLSRSQSK